MSEEVDDNGSNRGTHSRRRAYPRRHHGFIWFWLVLLVLLMLVLLMLVLLVLLVVVLWR